MEENYIRNDIILSTDSQSQRASSKESVGSKKRTVRNRHVKFTTLGIYFSIFSLLVAVISVGYRTPQDDQSAANVAPSQQELSNDHNSSALIGDVEATSIAAEVASSVNLSVAPLVTNLAQSKKIESASYTNTDSSSTKPIITDVSSVTRNIIKYTVLENETIDSIINKFGISKDTLKWSNNLISETFTAGTVLDILPRDGIVYTVKQGDTIDSITNKYKGDSASIISYNDLEISGIKTGLKIIIPNGVLPPSERPGYTAPALYQYAGNNSGSYSANTWRIRTGTPMYAGNNYAKGNCTAYVFDRRADLGNPVRSSWGNASSWAAAARAAGYVVNNNPSVGSVIQNGGGAGHVAVVEKILENGDLELSEMNYGGGWNIVSGRILPAALIGKYLYIH